MASPIPYRKKIRWPSDKQMAGIGERAADFIPYVSNLVNAFSKVPRPKAPQLIDPVTSQKISLGQARQDIEEQTRAADISTQGLDAHTGAAIRVGNMANKFRALSDINSREANANAQISNQANMINANINAQNTAMINNYQDDQVNAQMAQNRQFSENISNAADKYITQQAVKDQMKLEKDKTLILSKMFTPGVYDRLVDSLNTAGVNTSNMGGNHINPFAKLKNSAPPLKTSAPATTPTTQPTSDMGPFAQTQDEQYYLPSYMRKKNPKYSMMKFAAGGMMSAMGGEDPTKPVALNDDYYRSSATLAHYKDLLNQKLKAKNPDAFSNYFKGLVDLRRTGNMSGANQYVQNTPYNEYLSPDEVRQTLGDEGYNRYINSLNSVNRYNVQQGQQSLYGDIEGENDLSKLNYGRRFASLQITPSMSVSNKDRKTRYERQYQYNPSTNNVDYTESGDLSLRPDYLNKKAVGGSIKRRFSTGGKMYKPFC